MFQIHLSQNQFCCLLLHYILHVLNRHFPKRPVVMSFEFLFTIWRFAISAKLLLSKRPLCQLIRIFVYSLAIVAVNRHFCHFRQIRHFGPNRHFPKGPFAISFEFLFTFWRLIAISDIFANSCISGHILWFAVAINTQQIKKGT